MADLFEKFKENRGPLGQYADFAHGYFTFPKLEGEIGPRMTFRGKEMSVWNINNYLGLANHPEVRKEDEEASRDWGLAYPMGARIMSGESTYHEQLEQELATFVGKERGLLLNFGFQGVQSIIDALLGRHDAVVYDNDSHACIYDGVRLHLGKRFPFEHNDMESFEKQLARAAEHTARSKGGILVVTEGVFGMRGEQGRLREIIALREKYDFRLLVDDAHGFGVMGERGAGSTEAAGLDEAAVPVLMATLGKALGTAGAFVAGSELLVEGLVQQARNYIYTTALPPAVAAASLVSLQLLQTESWRRGHLAALVARFRRGAAQLDLPLLESASAIQPLLVGDTRRAVALSERLRDRGLLISAIRPPTVPRGTSRLRITLSAAHSEAQVDRLLSELADCHVAA